MFQHSLHRWLLKKVKREGNRSFLYGARRQNKCYFSTCKHDPNSSKPPKPDPYHLPSWQVKAPPKKQRPVEGIFKQQCVAATGYRSVNSVQNMAAMALHMHSEWCTVAVQDKTQQRFIGIRVLKLSCNICASCAKFDSVRGYVCY